MLRRLLLLSSVALLLVADSALAAPDPKLGKTALVSAVSGVVTVKEKGESKFGKLGKSPKLIPMGSVVDAERGKVRVRTARKRRGVDEGTFWRGAFGILQDRQEAVPEMFLQGERGDVACPAPTPTVVRRLWGKSDDPFRTVGWFSGVEVDERDTRWLTEDLCNGTRTTVKAGSVLTYDGPVRIMNIDAGATVQHFCDFDGIEPVSRVFCTLLTFSPELGLYGTGIVTLGDATSYDLCVTGPTGEERCETYALSEPINLQGHRESVVGCYTDGGPGAYSLRWRIDGVQIGPVFGFSSDKLAGQDCIHDP